MRQKITDEELLTLFSRHAEPSIKAIFVDAAGGGIRSCVRRRLYRYPGEQQDAEQACILEVIRALPDWNPSVGRWYSFATAVADHTASAYYRKLVGRAKYRREFVGLEHVVLISEDLTPVETVIVKDSRQLHLLLSRSKTLAADTTGSLLAIVNGMMHGVDRATLALQFGVPQSVITQRWGKFSREMRAQLTDPSEGRPLSKAVAQKKRRSQQALVRYHQSKAAA